MNSDVMRTFEQVSQWCTGALEQLGDASKPVCQLFFRYLENPLDADHELVCGLADGELVLILGPDFMPYPMPFQLGEGDYDAGGIRAYGVDRVVPGVWAVAPSFYVPEVIHAFVVIYDVPDPAPWEGPRIWVPPGVRSEGHV